MNMNKATLFPGLGGFAQLWWTWIANLPPIAA
jgi:hypothetical protein